MATSIDLEVYDKRRATDADVLQVAAKLAPFARWAKLSESLNASKSEKLEFYLHILYILLEDLLITSTKRGRDSKHRSAPGAGGRRFGNLV